MQLLLTLSNVDQTTFILQSKGNSKAKNDADKKLLEQVGREQSKTGKHEPTTLEEAMRNPQAGKELEGRNKDIRWPKEEGWQMAAQNVNGKEIHYQYNTRTGEIDDVKIILPK